MMKTLLAALLALTPATALAQTASEDLCTDRPSKSNNVCTVPESHVQIETDIGNWTRTDDRGTREDVILYTSPTLKLGIGPATDVQVTITPYAEVRTRDAEGTTRTGGFGDTYLRIKQRLTTRDATFQIGIMPFIKAPTAGHDVGNGAWEGGVSVPIQYDLPNGFALGSSPEVDVIEDADGRGRHIQLVTTANIGKTLGTRTSVGVELWTAQDFDPDGTGRQYSADVFATWLATDLVQLDAGANFGLNRQTPDVQMYFGVSTRF